MTDDNAKYKGWPAIPMGHVDTQWFYYFVPATKQVVRYKSSQHNHANFGAIAREQEWLQMPGIPTIREGREVDWTRLGEELMESCREKGIYDYSMVRGIGTWRDDGRTVYHAGSALYVDGKPVPFNEHESEFRYLARIPIVQPSDTPVTIGECNEFLEVLKSWNWKEPRLAPPLVLGWIGCATICGAVDWRPHLWITGRCQRRSKFGPPGRSKSSPPCLMRGEALGVVPVVHRRDPRCFV